MHDQIDRLQRGIHPRPERILGPWASGTQAHGRTVRALLPGITDGSVVAGDVQQPLRRVTGCLYEAELPRLPDPPGADYHFSVRYPDEDRPRELDDPYRFAPRLTPDDRADVNDGASTIVSLLGSHPGHRVTSSGRRVAGTDFAVWAPNARGVTVFGDFDAWGAQSYPMIRRDGVWELFVPGARVDDRYKYRVVGADGLVRDKADPLAHLTQTPPETASVIAAPSEYQWTDGAWIADRAHLEPLQEPMSIYEVHLGSWRRGLDYRRAAHLLADHLADMHFTHIQLMPVNEHPYAPSWGYQVGSFFAPTSRFGSPDDLRYLVDHLHSRGFGVLLDWVPAHFPKDEFALGEFDGTPLYEHADPLRRDQPDWGTYSFNLGRDAVRGFLLASARYWCDEFHVDGLRVDAVAAMLYRDYSRGPGQWRPHPDGGHRNEEAVDFLRALTDEVHAGHPGVLVIAEESTAWPGVTAPTADGGLGFDFKWDLGWMHETLAYCSACPAERSGRNAGLLSTLTEATRERYVLPLSHDEMVHGKGTLLTRMPDDRPADDVRALLAYQWAHPGKKLLFMGQEFGQTDEWSDHHGVRWDELHGERGPVHRGIAALVRDLGRIMTKTPALYAGDGRTDGLELLVANDTENAVIAFLRRAPGADDRAVLACLINFSDQDLFGYRIGLPVSGNWHEVLNTAAVEYHGCGLGNLGSVIAAARPSHGRPFSADVTLPARSAIWLVPA
ncbi:1,4-alpha-glucan branching protein GlgB [Gordonia zhaorongruii]|uniref:1,4-alpha-glucan branching protein GlgB n=1 Tax=Gordonia zhaorongruii TaxID=2597659 RepID=UPI00104E726C|nr:1,4-alpha-glucan branching protein GlgB [Gordonia zhaorongruii]